MNDKMLAWIGYALYAAALVSFGACALIAVILNYIKRGDCSSELIKSHMDWQIGTFWRAIIYGAIVYVVTFLLAITIIGLVLVWPIWICFTIWYIYRIAKGAIALNGNKAV